MKGWMEFLAARMVVLRECVKEGKTYEEIDSMLGLHPVQLAMLVERAKQLNAEEASNDG